MWVGGGGGGTMFMYKNLSRGGILSRGGDIVLHSALIPEHKQKFLPSSFQEKITFLA